MKRLRSHCNGVFVQDTFAFFAINHVNLNYSGCGETGRLTDRKQERDRERWKEKWSESDERRWWQDGFSSVFCP